MLDGDIHTDNRQLGLTCCGGCSRSQSPAGEGKEVRRAVSRSLRGECLQSFLLPSYQLFLYAGAKKRGFSHNPSGMALSHGGLEPVSRIRAEEEVAMDGRSGSGWRGVSVRPWCDALTSTHQTTVQGCQNQQYWGKDQQEEGSTETQRSRHVCGEIILHPDIVT